ncbi:MULTISPECIES: hypothetical protein [Alphaproteobacteria]|uniref:Uncharacterized protein n=2 Tax=Alphaproteobacteria TaxID=28211 RepID=A0A512HPZ1_9HYPH|nr:MULTISPECIES: hypothetical protein [Alphaproteobacteria]GEO87523.1 hypothetical protein RNA01_44550 [Ciceribacter naphthalenivorans]GLR21642.1 hypothetical protein GCM10007920_14280 [Ciceribacter naphthalenivorans]GLT04498.1 hypothetical protein GCM10007926_14280 [Sphingomonas psychrolutea]
MFSANRIMSDYIVDIADVSTYGCDPMSFEDLREEFEVLSMLDDEFDGLLCI